LSNSEASNHVNQPSISYLGMSRHVEVDSSYLLSVIEREGQSNLQIGLDMLTLLVML